jgi:hypothetical protein
VTVDATRSYDHGTVTYSIDGKQIGSDCNLHNAQPIASGPIELGKITSVTWTLVL